MGKISNMVHAIEFVNADDLFWQLDGLMNTDGEFGGDRRCYHVQNLKLVDKTHALVYFEEDFNVVRVDFIYNGEEITLYESPYSEIFLSYQEIQLMNDLGIVELEDREYSIEDIKYCIDECGVRCVEIYLN